MIAALSILLAAVSLNVTPLPGESHTTGTGNNRGLYNPTTLGSQSRTKTTTRTMKWSVSLRIRERKERPEKLLVESIYIAMDGAGKLKELKRDSQAVTLDKNGCASLVLESPRTTFTKRHTAVSRGGGFSGLKSGFRSMKTTTHGERIAGCVVRVFADGKLVKSWASDSRWTRLAEGETFSVAELDKNRSKI